MTFAGPIPLGFIGRIVIYPDLTAIGTNHNRLACSAIIGVIVQSKLHAIAINPACRYEWTPNNSIG